MFVPSQVPSASLLAPQKSPELLGLLEQSSTMNLSPVSSKTLSSGLQFHLNFNRNTIFIFFKSSTPMGSIIIWDLQLFAFIFAAMGDFYARIISRMFSPSSFTASIGNLSA